MQHFRRHGVRLTQLDECSTYTVYLALLDNIHRKALKIRAHLTEPFSTLLSGRATAYQSLWSIPSQTIAFKPFHRHLLGGSSLEAFSEEKAWSKYALKVSAHFVTRVPLTLTVELAEVLNCHPGSVCAQFGRGWFKD